MKKLTLLIIISTLFLGCNKKDDVDVATNQTVMVNVYYTQIGNEYIADPTLVRLYKQADADKFDYTKSVEQMFNNRSMLFTDGTVAIPVYTSDDFGGINIIKEVENGDYTIIAYFKPDGYTFSSFCYFGHKKITVSNEKGAQLYNIKFKWGMQMNGGDGGHFVEF